MNLNIITEQDAKTVTTEVKQPQVSIDEVSQGRGRPTGNRPQVTEDDLYTRLLKYIPTPLIGLYLLLVNGALSAFSGGIRTGVAWGLFALFALAIIPFLRTRKVRRASQIAVSVLAFVAWAIASPGPFSILGGWDAYYGTIALGVMTLFLIVFQTKPLPDRVLRETVTGT